MAGLQVAHFEVIDAEIDGNTLGGGFECGSGFLVLCGGAAIDGKGQRGQRMTEEATFDLGER